MIRIKSKNGSTTAAIFVEENREETLMARDKDEELESAKEVAKELGAPYNDTIKALKLKTAYLHILLEEKGGSMPQAVNA